MRPTHRDSAPRGAAAQPLRVGLVGFGAVGSQVVNAVTAGRVPGVVLTGVMDTTTAPDELAVADLDALLDEADVVVEAAGPRALHDIAPAVLGCGRILLAISVGAFLSPALAPALLPLLRDPAPGRLVLSTGAIAGLDLVRAARLAGPALRVELTTTKRPASLVQPWMASDAREALLATRSGETTTVFRGGATEAAELFPANLNVAAALALAAGSPEAVHVALIADPDTERTRHEVHVMSDLGSHRLVLENHPSHANPRTSGLVAWAVLRCLADLGPRAVATFL